MRIVTLALKIISAFCTYQTINDVHIRVIQRVPQNGFRMHLHFAHVMLQCNVAPKQRKAAIPKKLKHESVEDPELLRKEGVYCKVLRPEVFLRMNKA